MMETVYKSAWYFTRLEGRVYPFRIGTSAIDLNAALRERGVTAWCFLTSDNPQSLLCERSVNRAKQKLLEAKLQNQHLYYWPAWAEDPKRNWPRENGFLIENLILEDAIDLGRAFDQKAVVYCSELKDVELVWC